MSIEPERQRRLARNEVRFREINEALEADLRELLDAEERVEFVCECARIDCRDPVRLSLSEYEALRGDARRFAVAPGHELLEIERVITSRPGFRVVEKIGAGRDVASATDPRR